MLLSSFNYHRPHTLAEALQLLRELGDDASVYAGGTELLLAMKARVLSYQHLIDLKRINGLNDIRLQDGMLLIGAAVTHYRLANDPLVRMHVPAYAALSDQVANIRVRAAGTLAGNLCFGEPHADPPALLAALGASVVLETADSRREVRVADFIEAEFTTVRADDEIMTEIRIPVPQASMHFSYKNFGHLERPAVGIGAGVCRDTWTYGVWAGAISSRPVQLTDLESALLGVPSGELGDVLHAAARECAARLEAQSDLHGSADYKQHLASVYMRRAVLAAAGVKETAHA